MSQVSTWKCIKSLDLHTSAGEYLGIAFTESKLYQGEANHATPGGEWAMQFIDNSQTPHLITSKALHEHFVKLDQA